MNRLIFCDVDGTIKDGTRGMIEVSPKTKYAFDELKRNGDYVIISSGRSRCMMDEYILSLNASGYICCNGAYSEIDGKCVYAEPLDKMEIEMLIDYCDNNDGAYFLETAENIFVRDNKEYLIKLFTESWNVDFDFINIDSLDRDYYMAMTIFKTPEEGMKFERDMMNVFDIRQQNGYLSSDVNKKGINKGVGVDKIIEYLNIDKDNTYAFGDGINDLEMLLKVKHAVIMKNAQEPLKSYGFEMTDDVLEDGFYNYLVRNGLIKPMQ